MKKQITLTAVILLATAVTSVSAQASYSFSRILKGPSRSNGRTTIQASRLEADLTGGIILVTMPDTAGNTYGDYEFQWKFIDDISRLEQGKLYRFQMFGRRIGGTSDKNTNTAWMKSSNMGAVLAQRAGIQSLANTVEVTKSQSNVVAWPRSRNNAAHGVVRLVGAPNSNVTYFTFQFDFSSFPYAANSKSCSFEVVYVYHKNVASSSHVRTSEPIDRVVREVYRTDDNKVFRFTLDGDHLTGSCVIPGVARTTVNARYAVWTVADVLGNLVEAEGFSGTFETRLTNGTTIQGTTKIVETNVPGVIEICSTHTQNGRPVTACCTATIVSN